MIHAVLSRWTDRFRPWSAPTPTADAPTVAVVGAGAAGLATAVMLRRAGLTTVNIDRRTTAGAVWAERYDSLRLNSVRWMSDLPGLRMSRSFGRWPSGAAVATYLAGYAEHHGLDQRCGEVTRIDRAPGGWSVTLDGAKEFFDAVVVATGRSSVPRSPTWPGRDEFLGHVIHSSGYTNPHAYVGSRVVVAGAGSSGGEIVTDLVEAGVDVVWSVRSAAWVIPREVLGIPITPFGLIASWLPRAVVDHVVPFMERRRFGPRDYLPEPTAPVSDILDGGLAPLTADRVIEHIRSGVVQVVGPVESLTATDVVVADGTHIAADHLIAATGFTPALDRLVGHLCVLDERDGRPISLQPADATLAFVGYRPSLTPMLWSIEVDARRAARQIAAAFTSSARGGVSVRRR